MAKKDGNYSYLKRQANKRQPRETFLIDYSKIFWIRYIIFLYTYKKGFFKKTYEKY